MPLPIIVAILRFMRDMMFRLFSPCHAGHAFDISPCHAFSLLLPPAFPAD